MSRNCILFAEDDRDFVLLIQRALRKAGFTIPIEFVHDGQEAIDYLNGAGEYGDRTKHPMPQLVVLDIKMPRMDGFEVLEWVKNHPVLQLIPTVILSSSDNPDEINRAYLLRANSYLVKPMEFEKLLEIVVRLKNYWIEINSCPISVFI